MRPKLVPSFWRRGDVGAEEAIISPSTSTIVVPNGMPVYTDRKRQNLTRKTTQQRQQTTHRRNI